MTKILVTGASGFIGYHVVKELLSLSQDIYCLARETSVRPPEFAQKVHWVIGDLNDQESLQRACQGVELVLHLAGLLKAVNRQGFYRVNTVGTRHLLEALQATGQPHSRFVYLSSLAAGGPARAGEIKTESDPAYPVSNYGQSKLWAEIEILKRRRQLHTTIIRPPIVYGPGDRETLSFFKLACSHLNPHLGFKKHWVSLIHVADLVALILRAAKAETDSGEIFYAADQSQGYDWNRLVALAAECLDRWTFPLYIPRAMAFTGVTLATLWMQLCGKVSMLNRDKYREMVPVRWICAADKAQQLLGWQPEHDIQMGFRQTAQWYLQQGWIKP